MQRSEIPGAGRPCWPEDTPLMPLARLPDFAARHPGYAKRRPCRAIGARSADEAAGQYQRGLQSGGKSKGVPPRQHCRKNKVVGRTSVRRSRLRSAPRRTEVRPTKTAFFAALTLQAALAAACRQGCRAIPEPAAALVIKSAYNRLMPPSTTSSSPTIYDDISLARNSAALAISSGSPKRLLGDFS